MKIERGRCRCEVHLRFCSLRLPYFIPAEIHQTTLQAFSLKWRMWKGSQVTFDWTETLDGRPLNNLSFHGLLAHKFYRIVKPTNARKNCHGGLIIVRTDFAWIVSHPVEVTVLRLGAFSDRLTKLSSWSLVNRIGDVNGGGAASGIGTTLIVVNLERLD